MDFRITYTRRTLKLRRIIQADSIVDAMENFYHKYKYDEILIIEKCN